MTATRCVVCSQPADTDDGTCKSCGAEIPAVFGNVDLSKLGNAPQSVQIGGASPAVDEDAQQRDHAPAPFVPMAPQMGRPLHETSPSLDLSRAPARTSGRGRTMREGALRRAATEPVVQSSPVSRALLLVLLLVAAYVVYAWRS